jgi:hypothetical protein
VGAPLPPLHPLSGSGGSVASVVVVATTTVVLLVLEAQAGAPHASQQLGTPPTHADPPDGATQLEGSRRTVQRGVPAALVRQQVT